MSSRTVGFWLYSCHLRNSGVTAAAIVIHSPSAYNMESREAKHHAVDW
jgi:hypothetical protein